MKTKSVRSLLLACAIPGFALPARADFAPAAINSITVRFNGTGATYNSDLGVFTEILTNATLTTGPFRYVKASANVGKLNFTNWTHDSETYTGSFRLTFTSATGGTFHKNYTGTYNGYISGTFVVTAMDVPGTPVARALTVRMKPNEKAKFRLKGKGLDVRRTGLAYKITKKPKAGKLNTKKLPVVVYVPKPGFTGTEKFSYIVREGKSSSKPATVKLVVK